MSMGVHARFRWGLRIPKYPYPTLILRILILILFCCISTVYAGLRWALLL
jgi:hypothetical protein